MDGDARRRRRLSAGWALALAGAILLVGVLTLVLWPTGSSRPGGSIAPGEAVPPARSIPIAANEVLMGVYIENIQVVVPETNSFLGDVYVWYRWSNPDLRPYETVEFMNLYEAWQLMSWSSQEEPRDQPDGTLYYAARHQGAFNSSLQLRNYPFGTQELEIVLEDFESEARSFRFITEGDSLGIDPEISLPGYDILAPSLAISEFAYGTNFGDLDDSADERYSRATVTIPIRHPVVTNVIKYLVPIILVVIASALIFQIPPNMVEARIGLSITALLTLVAMQWSSMDGLPLMSYLTLLDALYLVSLVFILGSLIAGLRVSWLAREQGEEAAITVDERSMVVYLVAFAAAFGLTLAAFLVS